MKKFLSVLLCVAIAFSIPVTAFSASGTVYYIDSSNGDDTASGTAPSDAWKTTANIESLQLNPGDKVLFKCGGTYECTLEITCSGTEESPIVFSSYGEGEKPLLTTSERDAVFKLFDCSYVTVSDFEITAHNGGGIWVDALTKASYGVTVKDVVFHDIQNYKVKTRDNFSEGPISGRACIVLKRYGGSPYPVNDFTATGCEMYDCGNGVFITGSRDLNKNSLIENCYFHDMDAEAVVLEGCDGALVTNCRAIDCCQGEGVDENGEILYYIAAMWFHYSSNCTIQYCEIAGQKNVGDGMTVDFDHYSFNCTYQYIYSHDNMRFMVNNAKDDGQSGNTVRYCLSVNDGDGRNRLSTGSGEYNFRFYNNTIIGCGDFNLDDTYDSIIANNIIIPKKGSRISYNISEIRESGTVFTNNCYYDIMTPLIEPCAYNVLPGFTSDDISDPKSFMLSAGSPLIGAGYQIEDDCGTDFFGNKITSCNIGCYGGNGTDAEYQSESFCERGVRITKNVIETIVIEINYNVTRLIKKAKKYFEEKLNGNEK
ncbi:MAG: right-handed parallel beta-helix repeat-containing protein [Acutalibacteraceae bacterium]